MSDPRYNEVTWIATHNSYASSHEGYWYANQKLNIPEQLRLGVRGLLLDVYDNNGQAMLYHGGKWTNRLAQPLSCARTFRSALQEVREFLLANPQEVVTIFLECYITGPQVDNEVEAAGLGELVYQANFNSNAVWPLLSEMRNRNTRLVIFSDRQASRYAFYSGEAVRQNLWGTIRAPEVYQDYNAQGQIYLFNFFPEAGKVLRLLPCDNYTEINGSKLQAILREAPQRPNFIALNFVDRLPALNL